MSLFNNWMSSAVRTLVMVSLVVTFAWVAIGSLGVAQASLSGIQPAVGIWQTAGLDWSD